MRTSARCLMGLLSSTVALAFVLSWMPQVANSQQTDPTERSGSKTTAIHTVYLGPETTGMEGQQLRMWVITLEPGGHKFIHNPKNQPAVVYLLQGTDTVTFGEGTGKVFQAEDVSFTTANAAHWDGED